MPVLKDLLHGITPAKRQEINKNREEYLQNRHLSHDKIYNSPFSAKIVANLITSLKTISDKYNETGEDGRFLYVAVNENHVAIQDYMVAGYNTDITCYGGCDFSQEGYANLDQLEIEFLAEYLVEHLKSKTTGYCTCYPIKSREYEVYHTKKKEYYFPVFVNRTSKPQTPQTPPLKPW